MAQWIKGGKTATFDPQSLLMELPCGSIINGHLRALETMMPLSTEKLSAGSPAIFHALMTTGSPSVAISEKFSAQGMPSFVHNWFQSVISSCQ
jgi:hypothetical protein